MVLVLKMRAKFDGFARIDRIILLIFFTGDYCFNIKNLLFHMGNLFFYLINLPEGLIKLKGCGASSGLSVGMKTFTSILKKFILVTTFFL
jgi:hypothetical protein